MFTLHKVDKNTKARLGVVTTDHGQIESPFFMPVGTNGTVKSLTFDDLLSFDSQVLLSNTYHLFLRPGAEIIQNAGGLHEFINWQRPILTDSGGYQVFSLTKLRKLSDQGVQFRSHIDGSTQFFSPESVIEFEQILGSDMMMPLDVCAPYPCERKEAEASVRMTTLWMKRSKDYFAANQKNSRHKQYLFGIIQGATYEDLRHQSAQELLALDLDAYAIGGVSVGEPVKDMFETLTWLMPVMPQNKPRYFMGIGLPDQIVKAVGEGIDMFDTCIPTRFGRHGTAFTHKGKLVARNGEFAKDLRPLDEKCKCRVCQKYTRSYIRHLMNLNEITGLTLISYHNVYFYVNLMRDIRQAIKEDRYKVFQENFLKEYNSELLRLG